MDDMEAEGMGQASMSPRTKVTEQGSGSLIQDPSERTGRPEIGEHQGVIPPEVPDHDSNKGKLGSEVHSRFTAMDRWNHKKVGISMRFPKQVESFSR
jgi:hypothetical protein